ncbi:GTP-binding domain-containing protein [Encephalitozoon hellem]|uniref:Small COPII coat GTPase SAR1 n=1 Tax=Encephalitozoon hellem TaxID=27973 RepID=A0A9Q9F9A3_ENCHE|nr:putative sar1 [Encephalitozoon hellem ATCC 50504]AFM98225.1 putative sar1 [Encephalitozoon hellem ATCC 50504]KAG5859620.1 GTP-binding domain-containing protein [Encephalitozoon hellem]UTX43101.1 ADP-ribosylation factor 6 [Encephalitozoon hellem]WEL38558.1 small COPII coat GTPase SAR1 [Encephalitozoon hellem]|eukprot:XP_003887206.1 putative sar1 [Encephalitozoon hellem ATCC 50504]
MLDNIQEYIGAVKAKLTEFYEKVFQNFVKSLFGKPSSILFLGIDNAGKTTLVNKLKSDSTDVYMPTHHPSTSHIEIGNLKAQVIDLGGHTAARLAWRDYFYDCHGIVFIVDVHDVERFSEVREAYETVKSLEKKAPIVVLMNKIDLEGHTPETAEADYQWKSWLSQETGIEDQEDPERGQAVKIFYVTITSGSANSITGPLARAFKWLEAMISYNNKKESL